MLHILKTKEVLFVNRGVDISRPLSAQNDCFWWGYQNFSQINKPYFSFKRIVRGYQSNTFNDIENAKTRIFVHCLNSLLIIIY